MENLIDPARVILKRNPRGNIKDTFQGGHEKIRLTLEWIASFHFTALPILAIRLSIMKIPFAVLFKN